MVDPLPRAPLPCPECKERAAASEKGDFDAGHRIGNRRNKCSTCNNFVQNVMRLTRSRLKSMHEEEYERLRLQVEYDLYPQVIDKWSRERGMAGGVLSDESADHV